LGVVAVVVGVMVTNTIVVMEVPTLVLVLGSSPVVVVSLHACVHAHWWWSHPCVRAVVVTGVGVIAVVAVDDDAGGGGLSHCSMRAGTGSLSSPVMVVVALALVLGSWWWSHHSMRACALAMVSLSSRQWWWLHRSMCACVQADTGAVIVVTMLVVVVVAAQRA